MDDSSVTKLSDSCCSLEETKNPFGVTFGRIVRHSRPSALLQSIHRRRVVRCNPFKSVDERKTRGSIFRNPVDLINERPMQSLRNGKEEESSPS